MNEHEEFKSFLQGHEELTSELNRHNAVPLEGSSKDDPFYIAQMFQIDLDKDPRYVDIMAQYAVTTLNRLVTSSVITANRLMVGTLRLCALDNLTRQSLMLSGDMAISGVYEKFIFDTFDGDPSIALHVSDPYFIDPEMNMTPGTMIQINSLAIPVGSIEQWRLLPRTDRSEGSL